MFFHSTTTTYKRFIQYIFTCTNAGNWFFFQIEEYIGELNVEALGSFVKKTSSDLQSAAGEELQDLQNDDEEKPLMEDVLEKVESLVVFIF